MQQMAPNITLTNYEINRQQIVSSMASGNLDFFSDASNFSDIHLKKSVIATDRFVVLARKNHPVIQNNLSMEDFLKLGHINVSQRRTGVGPIDVALDKLGAKRQIVMRGQHFLTVPSAISKSNLIACIPYHLAKHYDLAMYEVPFELPRIEYFLYWHLSADNDAAHKWMRDQIAEVAKAYNHT